MTKDPTRTVVSRKAWIIELNKRFNKLKKSINNFIIVGDDISTNAFDYQSNPQAIVEFLAFLNSKVDLFIFENEVSAGSTVVDFWQNRYINLPYQRGIKIAQAQLRRLDVPLASTLQGVQPAPVAGTAQSFLGAGIGSQLVFDRPIHLDAIQVLYTRDYAQLRGVTDVMSAQMSRILADGIEKGLNVNKTAKNLSDRLDKIGKTRSKLIARTETVRAYNIGVINEAEELAKEHGLSVKFEWFTSEDERVRATHVVRHKKQYTKKQVLNLIGEPNCRCSVLAIYYDEEGKRI